MKKELFLAIAFVLTASFVSAQENSNATQTLKGSIWIDNPKQEGSMSSGFLTKIVSFSNDGTCNVVEFTYDTLAHMIFKVVENPQKLLFQENEKGATYQESKDGAIGGVINWIDDDMISITKKTSFLYGDFKRLSSSKVDFVDEFLFEYAYKLKENEKPIPECITKFLDYVTDNIGASPKITHRRFSLKEGSDQSALYLYFDFFGNYACKVITSDSPKTKRKGFTYKDGILTITKGIVPKPENIFKLKWNSPREFALITEKGKEYLYSLIL